MPAASRLFRFVFALALPLLSTLSPARTPNIPITAAPSKATLLFDFETRNCDGGTPSDNG